MYLKNLIGVMLIAFSGNTFAATLLEKQKQGDDLTATELVAIFLAEIKDCESKVPAFSAQATPLLTQLRAYPRFKEVENSSEFRNPKLQAEAAEVVASQRRGGDINNQCKDTLGDLQEQVKLSQQDK